MVGRKNIKDMDEITSLHCNDRKCYIGKETGDLVEFCLKKVCQGVSSASSTSSLLRHLISVFNKLIKISIIEFFNLYEKYTLDM